MELVKELGLELGTRVLSVWILEQNAGAVSGSTGAPLRSRLRTDLGSKPGS
jgi:hypothetical protein